MSSQTEEQSNEGIVNSVVSRQHGEQLVPSLRVKPVFRVGPADFRLLRRPEITVFFRLKDTDLEKLKKCLQFVWIPKISELEISSFNTRQLFRPSGAHQWYAHPCFPCAFGSARRLQWT